MKIKEAAQKYNLDEDAFTSFVRNYPEIYRNNKFIVSDEMIEQVVQRYREYLTQLLEQYRINAAEEQFKQQAMSEMLITSGFNFDGYTITRYSGYISGDDAIQIPRTGIFRKNDNGRNLTNALVCIRRQALMKLKAAAYYLGCNAVIGVDFDYMTLEPERANFNGGTTYEPYVICVTANGNAEVKEKNDTNVTQAFEQQPQQY